MRIDKTVVREVVAAIRNVVETPVVSQENNMTILSFRIDDINVRIARGDAIVFQGVLFKAFERMFFVTEDFELTMLSDEGMPVVVQDEEFVRSIGLYLRWRIGVLQQFGL